MAFAHAFRSDALGVGKLFEGMTVEIVATEYAGVMIG
jgi:hypothetical protein